MGVDFLLTSSLAGVEAAVVVVEGGSVEGWGLVLSFFTLSVVSWIIVGSNYFANFDFIFCTAFDQKSVILDFFVNDKMFYLFACLLAGSSSSSFAGKYVFIFSQFFPVAVWEVLLFLFLLRLSSFVCFR